MTAYLAVRLELLFVELLLALVVLEVLGGGVLLPCGQLVITLDEVVELLHVIHLLLLQTRLALPRVVDVRPTLNATTNKI